MNGQTLMHSAYFSLVQLDLKKKNLQNVMAMTFFFFSSGLLTLSSNVTMVMRHVAFLSASERGVNIYKYVWQKMLVVLKQVANAIFKENQNMNHSVVLTFE